jgi:hypothetical protein
LRKGAGADPLPHAGVEAGVKRAEVGIKVEVIFDAAEKEEEEEEEEETT